MKLRSIQKYTTVFACSGIMLLASCATILNEETQQVNVSSSTGKPITGDVDGVPFQGPGVLNLKRTKANKVINVSTASCTKQTVVNSEVDPKFFINILSGGTFGSST